MNTPSILGALFLGLLAASAPAHAQEVAAPAEEPATAEPATAPAKSAEEQAASESSDTGADGADDAGGAEANAEALAAKLANPVGSVYSVPIETTFDYGAANGEATFINLQPVIPISIGDNWNLINRTIVPMIVAPGTPVGTPGNPEPKAGKKTFGLGDISHSMFLSPAAPGKLIWGVGPILSLPTATSSLLGSQKWSAGPTAVLLSQPKPWTVGVLVGNLFSYAGKSDRADINQAFFQYFVNYGFDSGWYLTTTPMMTANWNVKNAERWVIPVGGGFGTMFKIGSLPIRTQLQSFYNAKRPTGGAKLSVVWTLQFVFPK